MLFWSKQTVPYVSTTPITTMGCWKCFLLVLSSWKVNIAENPEWGWRYLQVWLIKLWRKVNHLIMLVWLIYQWAGSKVLEQLPDFANNLRGRSERLSRAKNGDTEPSLVWPIVYRKAQLKEDILNCLLLKATNFIILIGVLVVQLWCRVLY